LQPPAAGALQPRPRLLERIAQWRDRPIVWVAAPPGYGKTSLAASHLAHARPASHVWYQLDPDDGDAATLFHYLSQSVAADLPLFAGEMAADLPRFARAFFRQFFARLTPPALVVFDDVHQLQGDGLAALIVGLSEIPAGVTVLALSREDPPAALARLQAHRRIGLIEADELGFTDSEALALAGDDAQAAAMRPLLARLQGWPAGIALTLERLALGRDSRGPVEGTDRETCFRYFASEVFERARAEVRDVLLACALLPSASAAQACELSSNPHAGRVLEGLHQRRLFVERRGQAEPTYHFHALFHEFLQAELAQRRSGPERRELAGRCARLLHGAGRCEEAALLFRHAEDWAGLSRLLAQEADPMLGQGRNQQWRTWLSWLPESRRDADTWLLFWNGVAQLHSAPEAAGEVLERAYRQFAAAGVVRGCLLTAADLVLFQHYERADYCALPRWVGALGADIGQLECQPALLSAEEQLRVQSALLIGLLFLRPQDPALQQCVVQVRQGLHGNVSASGKLAAGTLLLQYLNLAEGGRHAGSLIEQLQPLARQPEVCPFIRLCWQARLAFNQYLTSDFAASEATTAAARAEAASYGLQHLVLILDFNAATVQLAAGQLDAAQATLDAMRVALNPRRRLDAIYHSYMQTSLRLYREECAALSRDAALLLDSARAVEMPAIHLAHFMALRAGCHWVAQEHDQAQHWFEQAVAAGTPGNAERYHVLRSFAEAYRLLRTGHEGEAVVPLTAAFAEYKRLKWVPLLAKLRGVLQTLCAAAMEAGIEVDHVSEVIAAHGLAPPRYAMAQWPWPIRLRLLGKFSLAIAGKEVPFKGKMQKRPLELLGALVASGRGEVDAVWLRDRLWPDADGAAARTALDTTLYRVRKLLRSDTAIQLSGGLVRLDRTVLWTDAWALKALAEEARGLGPHVQRRRVEQLAVCLFDLYGGPFCGEEAAPCTLRARDQCRDLFVQTVQALGAWWEQRQAWDRAGALYTSALKVDELAEPFYQGLIRCALECGDPAAALAAFHRCAQALSHTLGTQPSSATLQLVGGLPRTGIGRQYAA